MHAAPPTHMECLTYQECVAWCRSRKYAVTMKNYYGFPQPAVRKQAVHGDSTRIPDRGEFQGEHCRTPHPVDGPVRRTSALDRRLGGRALHHAPLFLRFREAFGERRPFIQAPGHLIRGDELDDGISILLMTLLFTWDCTVLAGNEPVAFFCSHDE